LSFEPSSSLCAFASAAKSLPLRAAAEIFSIFARAALRFAAS